VRALCLLSGGLDSILAAKLILAQGIEVKALGFFSPFFDTEAARRSAADLGVEFDEVDIGAALLEAVRHPRYGWGKHLNPCTDCHSLMVSEAAARLEEEGADFIVTGEVLGQRGKSQVRSMLKVVARSAPPGLLLRPLCARLLPPTVPEEKGWVDRSRLLDLSGRGRRRQLDLVGRLGVRQYATPAGGCLLTDAGFCRRLRELSDFEGWVRREVELLKIGRHFRLPSGAKVVSARDRKENAKLASSGISGDIFFETSDRQRSLVLLRNSSGKDDLSQAAGICARYSKALAGQAVMIDWWPHSEGDNRRTVQVVPVLDADLEEIRI